MVGLLCKNSSKLDCLVTKVGRPIIRWVDRFLDELTWKCLQIQWLRAEKTPVMVQEIAGGDVAISFSSLDVLRRLGSGECSRRGERSKVLRGEGGGVLAIELHMMAGMLAALGRS